MRQRLLIRLSGLHEIQYAALLNSPPEDIARYAGHVPLPVQDDDERYYLVFGKKHSEEETPSRPPGLSEDTPMGGMSLEPASSSQDEDLLELEDIDSEEQDIQSEAENASSSQIMGRPCRQLPLLDELPPGNRSLESHLPGDTTAETNPTRYLKTESWAETILEETEAPTRPSSPQQCQDEAEAEPGAQHEQKVEEEQQSESAGSASTDTVHDAEVDYDLGRQMLSVPWSGSWYHVYTYWVESVNRLRCARLEHEYLMGHDGEFQRGEARVTGHKNHPHLGGNFDTEEESEEEVPVRANDLMRMFALIRAVAGVADFIMETMCSYHRSDARRRAAIRDAEGDKTWIMISKGFGSPLSQATSIDDDMDDWDKLIPRRRRLIEPLRDSVSIDSDMFDAMIPDHEMPDVIW